MKIIEFFKQLFCRHKWQQTSFNPVLKVADVENEYIQKWFKLFNRNFELKYSGFRKPQKKLITPHFQHLEDRQGTVFKNIDGVNFPWKWCDPWVHAYPFRSQIHPEPADNMIGWNTNLDSVRIYDTDEKRHMFMNKVPINKLEEGRTS